MFGFFSPRCPLQTEEKTWVEFTMKRFADTLGIATMRDAEVMLPTHEIFQRDFSGLDDEVESLLVWICGKFEIDRSAISFEIVSDSESENHLVTDENIGDLRIGISSLADQELFLIQMLFWVSAYKLVTTDFATGNETDFRQTVELLALYYGFGIFYSNAVMREDYQDTGLISQWEMSKHTELPARIFGYAFSHFAWHRNETNPQWLNYLRLDAKESFQQGFKFLTKTKQTVFADDGTTLESRSTDYWIDKLDRSFPSEKVAALWMIPSSLQDSDRPKLEAVIDRTLYSDDTEILEHTIGMIQTISPETDAYVDSLISGLRSPSTNVRLRTISALGNARQSGELVIPILIDSLGDHDEDIRGATAVALSKFGDQAELASLGIIRCLKQAVYKSNPTYQLHYLAALKKVDTDWEKVFQTAFAEDMEDVELRSQIDSLLEGPQPEQKQETDKTKDETKYETRQE